jgi:hypothetical protein
MNFNLGFIQRQWSLMAARRQHY